MSQAVLTTPKNLSEFYLFPPTTMSGSYLGTDRQKYWADPSAQEFLDGSGLARYTGLKLNPDGTLKLKDGKPYLADFLISLREARKPNIMPPVSGLAVADGGAWPFPINTAIWDFDNYYLEITPFNQGNPLVKDKRADYGAVQSGGGFTDEDRSMLKENNTLLKKIAAIFPNL